GTGRRISKDVVAAILTVNRCPHLGSITGQVLLCDKPAARFQLGDDLLGNLTLVERIRTVVGEVLKRRGQFRLYQALSLLPLAVLLAEDTLQFRKALGLLEDLVERAGQAFIDEKTVARQVDCRQYQFLPGKFAKALVRQA